MSGRSDAVLRMWAHESRRSGRRLPVPPDERAWIEPSREERGWINSLSSAELGRHVRSLNAVDRAVAGYRANHLDYELDREQAA